MNRLSFEKLPVEVQDCCRQITDHFRGIYKIYLNLMKQNWRMSTCNRLNLQTLGSQPVVMPKNLPITESEALGNRHITYCNQSTLNLTLGLITTGFISLYTEHMGSTLPKHGHGTQTTLSCMVWYGLLPCNIFLKPSLVLVKLCV